MSSSETKVIVVFAATGQIGRALIETLAAYNASSGTPAYTLLALTRNPTSSSALRLAKLPGVNIVPVEKDVMDVPSKVFEKLEKEGVIRKRGVHGVFSNQGYVSDEVMVKQGKAIADISLAWGVKHLVYSSVDFGGLPDTGVSAFEVKRQVENYIRSLPVSPLTSAPMGYTFLRPTQFMENLLPTSPFMFKMARTVLINHTFKDPQQQRKHQMISARDIGRAGALAFVNGSEWLGGEVRLAGDEFTMGELQATYKEIMGQPVSQTFSALAGVVSSLVPLVRNMYNFFGQYGNRVDIAQVRQNIPDMENLRAFLIRNKASGGTHRLKVDP